MEAFLERLIDERTQLDEKIEKLDSFIMSSKFEEVDEVQQSLLVIQASAMETYYKCLSERISWLTKE